MVSVHGSRCAKCKTNAKCKKCSTYSRSGGPRLPAQLHPEAAQIVIIEDQSILAKEVIDPITFTTTKDHQTLVQVHPDRVLGKIFPFNIRAQGIPWNVILSSLILMSLQRAPNIEKFPFLTAARLFLNYFAAFSF